MNQNDNQVSVPDFLTKEFFSKALKCSEQNMIIKDIEIKNLIPKGENYCSNIFQVFVKLQSDGKLKQCTFVAKCPAEVTKSEFIIGENEMLTNTLSIQHLLLEAVSPGVYPKFGPEGYDSPDMFKCLIMEDLKIQGFSMANKRQGLDFNHCALVMKVIARFHATSRVIYTRKPKLMDKYLGCVIATEESIGWMNLNFTRIYRSIVKGMKTWKNGAEMYADRISKLGDEVTERTLEVIRRRKDSYNVLIHGDFWCNNILFRYNKSNIPIEAKFVDYQFVYISSIALDILHFIYSSASDDVMLNDADKLVEIYLEEYNRIIYLLNASSEILTKEKLNAEIVERSFWGVHCAIFGQLVSRAKPEDDLLFNSLDSHIKYIDSSVLNPEFQNSLRKILPKLEQKGWL